MHHNHHHLAVTPRFRTLRVRSMVAISLLFAAGFVQIEAKPQKPNSAIRNKTGKSNKPDPSNKSGASSKSKSEGNAESNQATDSTPPIPGDFDAFDKAAAKVETEAKTAGELVATAKAATEKLTTAAKSTSFDEAALARFDALREPIESLNKDEVITKLDKASTDLTGAKNSLDNLYTKYFKQYETISPDKWPEESKEKIQKVLDRYKAIGTSVTALKIDDTSKDVKKAIRGAGTNLQKFLEDGKKKLHDLGTYEKADAPTLLKALPSRLADQTVAAKVERGRKHLTNLNEALGKSGIPKAEVDAAYFSDFDTEFSYNLPLIAPWLATINAYTTAEDKDAFALYTKLTGTPNDDEFLQAKAKLKLHDTDLKTLDALTKITGEVSNLWEELQKTDFPADYLPATFKGSEIADGLLAMRQDNARFNITLATLRAPVQVNIGGWTSDQIRLYYFDDVPRLLKVLNSQSGVLGGSDLREAVATAHKNLVEKSLALGRARQTVNETKAALERAQDELRLAQRAADDAKVETAQRNRQNAAETARRKAAIRNLQRSLDLQEAETARLQRALTAETDPKKKADLTEKISESQFREAKIQADLDLAKTADTDASSATEAEPEDTTLSDAKQAVTTAKGALTTALGEEKTASEAATDAAGQMYLAALVDNAQFAQARDNAPFYASLPTYARAKASNSGTGATAASAAATTGGADSTGASGATGSQADATTSAIGITPPDPMDSDPVQKVMLYGFPDSKTIFIRGRAEEVRKVKDLIASFDKPQTQTRMILYTLELSSQGTPKGASRTAKALEIIQDELAKSQLQTRTAESLLRECITDAALERVNALREAAINQKLGGFYGFSDGELAAAVFYDPDVLSDMGLEGIAFRDPAYTGNPLDAGINHEALDHDTLSVLNSMLPNPTSVSTLAEALLVLSLARRDYQLSIWEKFNTNIGDSLDAIQFNETQPSKRSAATPFNGSFPRLNLFVRGAAGNDTTPSSVYGVGTVSLRTELVAALQDHELTKIVTFIKYLADKKHSLEIAIINNNRALADTIDANGNPLPGEAGRGAKALGYRADRLNRELDGIEARIPTYWLKKHFPFSSTDQILEYFQKTKEVKDIIAAYHSEDQDNQERSGNARLAAANEMLKVYLTSANEDLHELFVRPMLYRLRQRLISDASIQVGAIQSTSVLGVNRLQARVDPSADAELEAGSRQNVLGDIAQLANFLGNISGANVSQGTSQGKTAQNAAQTAAVAALGGPAAAGGVQALQVASSAVSSATSQLDRLPQEAPPGVYGITTGNTFQVTPVADPSGQALRFRFDHVLSTQMREPNNNIVPQLSRIERHSINTEVQLSNNEIRLVSQFDSTTRLGIPSHRRGGLPILKDIPILSDIPLIGWFSRFKGKAADMQQSLVLAQTQMYPTLNDIIDLLPRPIHNISDVPGVDATNSIQLIPDALVPVVPPPANPPSTGIVPAPAPVLAPRAGGGAASKARQPQKREGENRNQNGNDNRMPLPNGAKAGAQGAENRNQKAMISLPTGTAYIQTWNYIKRSGTIAVVEGPDKGRTLQFDLKYDVQDEKLRRFLRGLRYNPNLPQVSDAQNAPAEATWVIYGSDPDQTKQVAVLRLAQRPATPPANQPDG